MQFPSSCFPVENSSCKSRFHWEEHSQVSMLVVSFPYLRMLLAMESEFGTGVFYWKATGWKLQEIVFYWEDSRQTAGNSFYWKNSRKTAGKSFLLEKLKENCRKEFATAKLKANCRKDWKNSRKTAGKSFLRSKCKENCMSEFSTA